MGENCFNTVDVVVMTVGQQNIRDPNPFFVGKGKHFLYVPCRIYYRCSVAAVIMQEINKVLHGAEFHCMNRKIVALCHGVHLCNVCYGHD